MDSEELIQRVVQEVLKKMAGSGAGGPAPGRGSGGARPRSGPRPAGTGRPAAGACLVVLTAGDGQLDEVYRQLGRLEQRYGEVNIFLSPSARKVLDLPAIRRACPGAHVLPAEVTYEMRELVDGCDALFLPNLTLSTASKIAFLDGDSAASLLPIFALMRGKPVVACPNSVFGLRSDFPDAPEGFRNRVQKIMTNLKANGVRVVDITELSEPSSAGAASVPAAAGKAAAAPAATTRPAGSAAASADSKAGSAEPPCAGDPEQCEACGQCAEKNPPAVKSLVDTGAARIGAAAGTKVADKNMAGLIDHTLLRADATEEDIRKLCEEARKFSFASVCVNPTHVSLAARLLRGSKVKVCTVIGFPLGATTPTAKAIETRDAIANGAREIDMVINVGALKSGNDDLVRRDIAAVVEAARGQAIVKVILETALLSKEEKVKACLLAKMAGADFVKTSTGFGPGGATVEDIALMRQTVGPEMGVKASGGIRDAETARAMVAAGATRIGASASVAITKGERGESAY